MCEITFETCADILSGDNEVCKERSRFTWKLIIYIVDRVIDLFIDLVIIIQ